MFDVLGEVAVKEYTDNFQCSTQKGYPEFVKPLSYYVKIDAGEILGYSCFSDMGDFYFVGNTYIMPQNRGQGIYSKLLSNRNKYLGTKPKVTIANPIEGTDMKVLKRQVAKQGGVEVSGYEDVSDIMSEETYNSFPDLPMFIYR